MRIVEDDPAGAPVAALLRYHLEQMHLNSPPGSGFAFDPALALYRRRGFVDGGAFGDYERTAFNQFLHLDL